MKTESFNKKYTLLILVAQSLKIWYFAKYQKMDISSCSNTQKTKVYRFTNYQILINSRKLLQLGKKDLNFIILLTFYQKSSNMKRNTNAKKFHGEIKWCV